MRQFSHEPRSITAYDALEDVMAYDAKMDIMHPNRHKMAEIICALLPFHRDSAPVILDLGTGTGFLAARVLAAFPQAKIIAIDGAAAMMKQAHARLGEKAQSLNWKICTFQELAAASQNLLELNAVISAFALHHLDSGQKLALLRALHQRLRTGGWLINADIVISPHAEVEQRYQRLRQAGIQKRWRERHREERTLAAIAAELAELEERDGDQPLSLETDLRLLHEAGFAQVDCFWKETREVVIGGVK